MFLALYKMFAHVVTELITPPTTLEDVPHWGEVCEVLSNEAKAIFTKAVHSPM